MKLSFSLFKLLTILLPPIVIGGFEYFRHEFLLDHLSMEAGNFYMVILTLLLSFLYASWMFKRIEQMNATLALEQAKRAVYEERERLASELHDNIAQSLFFLQVKLKKEEWKEASAAVSEINNHVRQSIFNLRSLPDEKQDLQTRLELWLAEWAILSGVDVDSVWELPTGYFSPAEEINLFAFIQEAFTNIRKHANATHAAVNLTVQTNGWSLKIIDDGIGLEEAAVKEGTYGLALMAKRAHDLRAEIKLTSPENGGTQITVSSKYQKA